MEMVVSPYASCYEKRSCGLGSLMPIRHLIVVIFSVLASWSLSTYSPPQSRLQHFVTDVSRSPPFLPENRGV